MMKTWMTLFLITAFLYSCSNSEEKAPSGKHKHLIRDINIFNEAGDIQAVIEIPAGSHEKWEVNKKTGIIERDSVHGSPRRIDYLGYPANYGFIPQTVLSRESGGDGDPLDAIILGKQKPRGTIVSCRVVGVLKLEDNGEQDDKLILTDVRGPMAGVKSLRELEAFYPNVLTIIRDWFTSYKGPREVVSFGYAERGHANKLIKESHNQFIKATKK